jgi:uncharacterized coiled-coil DUF342 family protein
MKDDKLDLSHMRANAREAFKHIVDEIEDYRDTINHLNGQITTLETKVEIKEIEIDSVNQNCAELSLYIKELETALAEAHLMSKEPEDNTCPGKGDCC